MEFMDKKLEDIVVTLPFADGTSMDCGVFSYFEVNHKKYFALLPLKGEKELDYTAKFMLYEVEEDEEHNPVVMYIEDDEEYAIAAQCFSEQIAKKSKYYQYLKDSDGSPASYPVLCKYIESWCTEGQFSNRWY